MDVYCIGEAAGPQRVGTARCAADVYQEVRKALPGLSNLHLRALSLDTGRAMLVNTVFSHQHFADLDRPFIEANGIVDATWYDLAPDRVMAELANISELALPSSLATTARHVPSDADVGAAIRSVRTKLFGTTQELFGEMVGKSHVVVSRWEAGEAKPGLDELLRIRAAARAFGLPYEDSMILVPNEANF